MAHAHAGSMDLTHAYPHEKTALERFLDTVERVGNKVPHPVVIFVLLIGLVILLSHVLYLMGVSATYETVNPDTDAVEEVTSSVRSLLTRDGIRFMMIVCSNVKTTRPIAVLLSADGVLRS